MREQITVNGKDYWLSVKFDKPETSTSTGRMVVWFYIKVYKSKYSLKPIKKMQDHIAKDAKSETLEEQEISFVDKKVTEAIDNFFNSNFIMDFSDYRYGGEFRKR